MKKHFVTNKPVLTCIVTAAVSVVITFAILAASGWQRPAASLRARSAAVSHSLPHWMLAAGLLGSPAMPPNPSTLAGSAYEGVAEYATPGAYPFTVPEDVTTVLVQFYSGGGGGSGGSSNHGGGGGGGGAYVMTVVTVTPGATYTINVGAGGSAGGLNVSGGNGGDTSLVGPDGTVIVAAGGGAGGQVTGHGGMGGQLVGNPMLGHAGHNSTQNSGSIGFELPTFYLNSPLPSTRYVGTGGIGKQGISGNSLPGEQGYALIAW